MKKNIPLVTSTILTLLVVATILGVNLLSQVLAQRGGLHSTPVQPASQTSPIQPAAAGLSPDEATSTAQAYEDVVKTYQAQALERERSYQTQLEALNTSLQKLDAESGAQLQDLQDQLATAEATLNDMNVQTEAAQQQATELQQAIQAIDQDYQTQMSTMVTTAQQNEMVMRAQIEALYADLQTAYDEIAARQVAPATTAGISSDTRTGGEREGEHESNEHPKEGEEHNDD